MSLQVRPLVSLAVTSPYGPRIIGGQEHFHDGTDYEAAVGTPLFASGSGIVQAAGFGVGGDGGGYAVAVVDDDDGQLFYLHLSDIRVRAGDAVEAGTLLGLTGDSGRVTGPHLHVQWRPLWPARETADVDPVFQLLPPPPSPSSGGEGAGLLLLPLLGWLLSR